MPSASPLDRLRSVRLPVGAVRETMRAVKVAGLRTSYSVPTQRRIVGSIMSAIPGPPGVSYERARIGGVDGEWALAPGAPPRPVVLYLHGGGYAIGAPRTHRPLTGTLARALGLRTFVADYRLAPEHPFPAAADDALAAYKGLLDDGIGAGEILVAGDSAGGGAALALAFAARDEGLPQPAVLGLICPWVDLTPEAAATRTLSPREPLLTPELLEQWAAAYAGTADRRDPRMSPILGDLTGLPPVVLHSAGDDLLNADSERLEAALREAGVTVEHQRHAGVWHDFHLSAGTLAASDAALERFAASLRAHLRAPAAA
jgi:acetyl esterase/lipase